MAPLEKSPFPPDSGFDFVGLKNLQHDIYPAIDPSKSTTLHQPGKVVLITGAGRGIGRAMAIQYAHAKVSTIILCARTASELDEVEEAVKKVNARVHVRKETFSVTDNAAVKDLALRVREEVGRLDVLINNAGLSRPWEPIGDTDPEDYWQVLEVNLKGPLLLLHAFLPLLTSTASTHSTHVNVINVTSIGAVTVMPGGSSYALAKLALQRMSEFIGLEYGGKGVDVVGLHPGAIPTKLANTIDEIKPYLTDTPELTGGFVVWLTSKERSWLNGRYVAATWNVDILEKVKAQIIDGDKLKMKMVV